MKSEIEQTLKTYLSAFYQQDFDTMLPMLYEDDVIEYHRTFVDFAVKMDYFGETSDFLDKLKIPNLQSLKEMSTKDFMVSIFKMATSEISQKELKKMLKGIEITHIDDTELMSIVSYRMPFKLFDEWDFMDSQVSMIYSGGSWKIFFQSGLSIALKAYENEINLYHERKSRDKPDNIIEGDDLIPYTLTGYKNGNGEIVFEARFKDAGRFSEGLAYVKIIDKYGYIDLKGEISIKPAFLEARDFSEELAAVKVAVPPQRLWGFINKEGEMTIPPIYEAVSYFSEGLCAVMKENKWGYIDKEGNTVIPHSFFEAEDFEDGVAEVELLMENGNFTTMTLDREGNMID